MDTTEYIYLLNKPSAINDKHSVMLEKIISDFPYFQSAKALQLKNLYNQNSFKYNNELKITAAHTTDRTILFDFIVSDIFLTIEKKNFEAKEDSINNIQVNNAQIITINNSPEILIDKMEQSIITSINQSNSGKIEEIEAKIEIGKPLEFTENEKHSFQEWLQLSSFKKVIRTEDNNQVSEKEKYNAIIDKFIETNPKIPPITEKLNFTPIIEEKNTDNSYLMTETLAKVYLEQKKYKKAIQAYEILILKYPEKISFFADRISDIKDLQQNNI